MKILRISIGSIMAAVIVIAIDCITLQSIDLRFNPTTRVLTLIVLGCLPMANLLAFGLERLIRARGQGRPFLLGFEVCGGVAFLAWLGFTIAAPELALEAISTTEPLLEYIRTSLGIGQSPVWDLVMILGFVPTVLLVSQLILGLAGGLLARKVRRRAEVLPVEGSTSRRTSFGSIAAMILVVAIPSVAIEGVRDRKITPKTARFSVGTEAMVDLEIMPKIQVKLADGTAMMVPDGTKVRVEGDTAPASIGGVAEATRRRVLQGDLRPVQVTMLEGPGAGGSTSLSRLFLRPRR